MTTLPNALHLRCLHATLAALALAAGLFGLAPAEASAQARGRRATAAAQAPQAAEQPTSTEGMVNIQTATSEQLQLLPGVGPSKAQAIVESRERRAFRRVEDIMRARGIGRGTFRRLRPMLTVDGPTTLAAPTRQPRAARRARPAAEEVDDLDLQD